MLRSTVQLQHNLPDGSGHIDWLLDIAGDAQSPLTTFRLPRAIHFMGVGEEMKALRIADHRRLYLDYEGPISGDRGVVKRIAAGRIVNFSRAETEWLITIQWEQGACASEKSERLQRLLLRCEGSPDEFMQSWSIFSLPSDADSP